MRIINVDLFDCPTSKDAICVTTNAVVKSNGCAVMGAGIAKIFALKFPDLPAILAQKLQGGNHAYYLKDVVLPDKSTYAILSFPTKNDWRNPSDLQLILRSCNELTAIVEAFNINNCYIPLPGCGYGQLDPDEVIPAISNILNDKFVLVLH